MTVHESIDQSQQTEQNFKSLCQRMLEYPLHQKQAYFKGLSILVRPLMVSTENGDDDQQDYNEIILPLNKLIAQTAVKEALQGPVIRPWGHLVAVDGSRGVDECCDQLLVQALSQKHTSRIFVISNINSRADEFSRNIDHCLDQMKLGKSTIFGKYLAKGKPLEQDWDREMREKRIFLMLHKTFYSLLQHGLIALSNIDLILFDFDKDFNSSEITSESVYSLIIRNYVYNRQTEGGQLPRAIFFTHVDSLRRSPLVKDNLRLLCDILNVRLMQLNGQELICATARSFRQIRGMHCHKRTLTDINKHVNSLKLLAQKVIEYSSFLMRYTVAKEGVAPIEPSALIEQKSVLPPQFYFSARRNFLENKLTPGLDLSVGGRATIYDAKYITENFLKSLIALWNEIFVKFEKQAETVKYATLFPKKMRQIKDYLSTKQKEVTSNKLKTEKIEKVEKKVRAFTFKLFIDEQLKPFFLDALGKDIDKKVFFVRRGVYLVDNAYKAINFSESRATKFRKSTQAEFFLHCELVHHLYCQCGLNNQLMPDRDQMIDSIVKYITNQEPDEQLQLEIINLTQILKDSSTKDLSDVKSFVYTKPDKPLASETGASTNDTPSSSGDDNQSTKESNYSSSQNGASQQSSSGPHIQPSQGNPPQQPSTEEKKVSPPLEDTKPAEKPQNFLKQIQEFINNFLTPVIEGSKKYSVENQNYQYHRLKKRELQPEYSMDFSFFQTSYTHEYKVILEKPIEGQVEAFVKALNWEIKRYYTTDEQPEIKSFRAPKDQEKKQVIIKTDKPFNEENFIKKHVPFPVESNIVTSIVQVTKHQIGVFTNLLQYFADFIQVRNTDDLFNSKKGEEVISMFKSLSRKRIDELYKEDLPQIIRQTSYQEKQGYTEIMIATLLSLGLNMKVPNNYKAKQEVERWRLVGESFITFAINFEIFLSSDLSDKVDDLNSKRTELIRSERISQVFQSSQWQSKFMFKKSHTYQDKENPAHVQVQILSGLLSTYFGFEAAICFLISAGVVSYNHKMTPGNCGEKDVSKALQEISKLTSAKIEKMQREFTDVAKSIVEIQKEDKSLSSSGTYLESLKNMIKFSSSNKLNYIQSEKIRKTQNISIGTRKGESSSKPSENQSTQQLFIEEKGFTFEDSKEFLILLASTHNSFQNGDLCRKNQKLRENKALAYFNYQQLEYLGDAIINMLTIRDLYLETIKQNRDWHDDYYPAQQLQSFKAYQVSNTFLSYQWIDNFYLSYDPRESIDPQFPILITKTESQSEQEFSKQIQEYIDPLKKLLKKNRDIIWDVQSEYQQEIEYQNQIQPINALQSKALLRCTRTNQEQPCKFFPISSLQKEANNQQETKDSTMEQTMPRDIQARFTTQSQSSSSAMSKSTSASSQNDSSQNKHQIVTDGLALYTTICESSTQKSNPLKVFADVFEAQVGAIFLASQSLQQTERSTKLMLTSTVTNYFSTQSNIKLDTELLFKSKPYNKDLFLDFNKIEEKDIIYYQGYIATRVRKLLDNKEVTEYQKLDIRKVKFTSKANDKQNKFYQELQKYLTEAYLEFETRQLKAKGTFSSKEWLSFNKNYRKEFNGKEQTDCLSIIDGTAFHLYKQYQDQNLNDFQLTREKIEGSLKEAFSKMPAFSELSRPVTIEMEHEKCRNPRIMHLSKRWTADDSIPWLVESKATTFDLFIASFPEDRLKNFFFELLQFGEKKHIKQEDSWSVPFIDNIVRDKKLEEEKIAEGAPQIKAVFEDKK